MVAGDVEAVAQIEAVRGKALDTRVEMELLAPEFAAISF